MKTKSNYLRIRSKNNSASLLRRKIEHNGLCVYRMGSKTPLEEIFRYSSRFKKGEIPIEINSIQGCINSSNKKLMKECFDKFDVQTAMWCTANKFINSEDKPFAFPVVVKQIYGSKNLGNALCKNMDEVVAFIGEEPLDLYIIERFYTYSKEYRIHATKKKGFYALRKMLSDETEDSKRWFRNDSNCVWILEDNPMFAKPDNWDSIMNAAAKAICSVGLDIGCVDVKVQATMESPRHIIIETNSAPGLTETSAEKYVQQLNSLLRYAK